MSRDTPPDSPHWACGTHGATCPTGEHRGHEGGYPGCVRCPAFDVPVLSAAEVSGLDASAGAVAVHQAAARLGRVPRKVKKSAKRRLAQHR